MKKVQRTDDNIIKIVLSFCGANENLYILEKEYLNNDILTIPQYVNYLSQIALCIELGMKSILLNENDVLKIHNLKELFNLMPEPFREKFNKSTFPKKTIDKSLEKIKTIFEDFRYMNTDHLDFFLDKSIFTTDYKIQFSQVMRLQNFNFFVILLDEIKIFYSFIANCIDKNKIFNNSASNQFTLKPDVTELNKAIAKYNDELNKVQTSTIVVKK